MSPLLGDLAKVDTCEGGLTGDEVVPVPEGTFVPFEFMKDREGERAARHVRGGGGVAARARPQGPPACCCATGAEWR
jgi:hypothetical protein